MPLLFVYGSLTDGDDAAWLGGLSGAPATTRGWLWSDARRRPVLVPDPQGDRIPGTLVEVDPARRDLLTLLLAGRPEGGQAEPGWQPVSVSAGLRPVTALAWGMPDARHARLARLRPPRDPAGQA